MLKRHRAVYGLVALASLTMASYQPADAVASNARALAHSIDRLTRLVVDEVVPPGLAGRAVTTLAAR